jgi:predicted transcriptional regulator
MTNLTIRIDQKLKTLASEKAQKLGISVSLVVKSALINFVESEQVIIGKPKVVEVSPLINNKLKKISKLL